MKLKLSRSKTEKNYEPNKYKFNLSTNKFNKSKDKQNNNIKNLKIRSLSNLEEEYFPRLKYKFSEDKTNKKNFFLGNFQLNSQFPLLTKTGININNMKLSTRARKSIFLMRNSLKEDKLKQTKYEGKFENIYKENILESKRAEIETKINKIKGLMEPLSFELSKTLKQIDNYNLDLEIIKNLNFSDNKLRKLYLPRKKSISVNSNNLSSSKSISTDRLKPKEFESMIKLEKMKIHKNKLDITHKLETLYLKKDNILIRIDTFEKGLNDLKIELNKIKDELMKHYHKLLFEGKDTRNEGLSWIIRAIWKLRMNVIMSYLPKFLDEKSIEFLFKYSDKLVEMEQIQKNIEKKNDYLKKIGKRIGKLSEKLLQFEEYKDNNDDINDENDINIKEDEKNKETPIISPRRIERVKTFRTPSMILLKNIRRRNMLMTEINPINALKKLISEGEMSKPLILKEVNSDDTIQEKESNQSSKSSESSKSLESSKIEEETFKTSLYDPKKSFKNLNKIMNKPKQSSNKIFQNLELMLDNPNYLDKLTSHVAPTKKLKISDYENMKNFKIEDLYDQEMVKIFNEHKNLLMKLKQKKKEAEKFMRNEIDRIGKCFYLEDYSGKFNTDLKTVIGALIGEDNAKLEVFRLQREQKEYFKTLKSLRTFNLLNKKIY